MQISIISGLCSEAGLFSNDGFFEKASASCVDLKSTLRDALQAREELFDIPVLIVELFPRLEEIIDCGICFALENIAEAECDKAPPVPGLLYAFLY